MMGLPGMFSRLLPHVYSEVLVYSLLVGGRSLSRTVSSGQLLSYRHEEFAFLSEILDELVSDSTLIFKAVFLIKLNIP